MLSESDWLRSFSYLLRRNERVDGHNTHSKSLGLLADQTSPTLPKAWMPTFLPWISDPVAGVNWLRDI